MSSAISRFVAVHSMQAMQAMKSIQLFPDDRVNQCLKVDHIVQSKSIVTMSVIAAVTLRKQTRVVTSRNRHEIAEKVVRARYACQATNTWDVNNHHQNAPPRCRTLQRDIPCRSSRLITASSFVVEVVKRDVQTSGNSMLVSCKF